MDLIEYGADPQLPDAEGRSVELFLNVLCCLSCYKGYRMKTDIYIFTFSTVSTRKKKKPQTSVENVCHIQEFRGIFEECVSSLLVPPPHYITCCMPSPTLYTNEPV